MRDLHTTKNHKAVIVIDLHQFSVSVVKFRDQGVEFIVNMKENKHQASFLVFTQVLPLNLYLKYYSMFK